MTSLIEMLDVAITSPEFSTISRRSIDLEIVSSLGKLEGDIERQGLTQDDLVKNMDNQILYPYKN